MRAAFAAALSVLVLGVGAAACGGAEPGAAAPSPSPSPSAPAKLVTIDGPSAPSESAVAAEPAPLTEKEREEQETRKLVSEMLVRVAKARGLPVKREVKSRELARPAMLARIRKQVEEDVPMDVIDAQGEVLAAMELVPPEYDFIAGTFRLIEGQIAGFYTPSDGTMYLADDLSAREADETLAHELVHALQDQSYSLGAMIKYRAGDSDRLSAVHALIEGDATSAMLDVSAGSAFNISESMLRRLLAISTAVSTASAGTPRVLQSSLIAPYSDGFAFVQGIRRRGGWKAVDAVWTALPDTTEQLLHLDKFDAREPALNVPPPSIAALGSGFRQVVEDAMGEQGLRIILEEWTHLRAAEQGAAGWGGDRYSVARRDAPSGSGPPEIAVGWHLRLDTAADAREVSAILKARFGVGCRLRPALGPIAWKAQGSDIAIAAGPYERQGRTPKGTGSCALATKWAAAILKDG